MVARTSRCGVVCSTAALPPAQQAQLSSVAFELNRFNGISVLYNSCTKAQFRDATRQGGRFTAKLPLARIYGLRAATCRPLLYYVHAHN